jgi:hypothetical protein
MIGTTFDTGTSALATKCITWAENEINKKLVKRYDITAFQTTVPPVLESIAEQLSIGMMYEQMSRGSKESLNRAEQIKKSAMDNLKDLSENKIGIADTAGSIISPRTGAKGVLDNTSGFTPTFAEDSPLNWEVDSDKLDAIDGDRN